MPANDTYLLTAIATSAKQYGTNVWAYRQDGPDNGDTFEVANDLVGIWISTMQSAWLDCFAGDYILSAVKAQRVAPTGGISATQLVNQVGTFGTATSSAAGVGGEVRFPVPNPAGGPKWISGKTFLMGYPSGGVINNLISAPYYAAMTAWAALQVQELTGAIASYVFGVRTIDPLYATCTDAPEYEVDGSICFQRRREAPTLGRPSRSSHHRGETFRARRLERAQKEVARLQLAMSTASQHGESQPAKAVSPVKAGSKPPATSPGPRTNKPLT